MSILSTGLEKLQHFALAPTAQRTSNLDGTAVDMNDYEGDLVIILDVEAGQQGFDRPLDIEEITVRRLLGPTFRLTAPAEQGSQTQAFPGQFLAGERMEYRAQFEQSQILGAIGDIAGRGLQ